MENGNCEPPEEGPEHSKKESRLDPESRAMWMQAGQVGHIGIMFGLGAGLGFLIGRWLDEKFGTKPYLTLFFVLCGIGAGIKELFLIAKRAQREDHE